MITMIRHYRKKVFVLLFLLLLLLAFTFLVSLLNPSFNFIDLGLPNDLENKIIAVFSFLSMLLVLWDLKQI